MVPCACRGRRAKSARRRAPGRGCPSPSRASRRPPSPRRAPRTCPTSACTAPRSARAASDSRRPGRRPPRRAPRGWAPRARSARRRAPPAFGPRGAAPSAAAARRGIMWVHAGVGPNQTELAQDVARPLGGHRAEIRAELPRRHRLEHGDARFARALRERGDGLLRLHGAHRRRGGGGGHGVDDPAGCLWVHARQHGAAAAAHVHQRLRGDAGGHTAQRARGALGRGRARLQAAAAEREHPRIGGVGVAPAVLPPSLTLPSLFTRTRRTRSTPASSTKVSSVHSPRVRDACPSDGAVYASGGDGGGGGGGGGGLHARRGAFVRHRASSSSPPILVFGVPTSTRNGHPGKDWPLSVTATLCAPSSTQYTGDANRRFPSRT